MKYEVKYIVEDLDELKKALLYMLPSSSEFINNIENIQIPDIMNFILVDDDKISLDKYYDYNIPCFYCKTFINVVELLQKCDDKTFVMKLDDYDFSDISKNETIHYRNYIPESNTLITINNTFYTIDYNESMFFTDFKHIDYNTYLRSIKLKQIL